MTTAALAAVLAAIQPVVTRAGRIALAGYRGLAREVYALDLRQFASWCRTRSVALSAVRRAGIEAFARELDAMGRARAAARRLSAIAGSCKYAAGEDLRERAPAVPARRPRADCESRAACRGPWRTRCARGSGRARAAARARADLGARPERAAGLRGHRCRHQHLGLERGHRTVTITGTGGTVVIIARADRPGARPGHRRTHRGTGVPGR